MLKRRDPLNINSIRNKLKKTKVIGKLSNPLKKK